MPGAKFPLSKKDIIIGKEPTYPEDIGKTYNRLTILFEVDIPGPIFYACRCSCDKHTICYVARDNIKNGNSKSCGCLRIEAMRRNRKPTPVIHGQTSTITLPNGKKRSHKTRIYCVWDSMIQRCENSRCSTYPHYGGRGISVCKKWHKFNTFFKWAKKNGYNGTLTLDRINVDGNYSPKNCRWVDYKTQAKNKRNNNFFIINGKRIVVSELCEKMGLSRAQLIKKAIAGEIIYDYWSHEGKFFIDKTHGNPILIQNS